MTFVLVGSRHRLAVSILGYRFSKVICMHDDGCFLLYCTLLWRISANGKLTKVRIRVSSRVVSMKRNQASVGRYRQLRHVPDGAGDRKIFSNCQQTVQGVLEGLVPSLSLIGRDSRHCSDCYFISPESACVCRQFLIHVFVVVDSERAGMEPTPIDRGKKTLGRALSVLKIALL